MAVYPLNRGIGKSVEFMGFAGNLLLYLALGIGAVLLYVFALFVAGVYWLFTLGSTAALGAGLWYGLSYANAKYGEYGLQKAQARQAAPNYITNRTSRLFLNLNEDAPARPAPSSP